MIQTCVRAPDHLGDGVMALPALARLARAGDVVVAAPAWAGVLYRDLGVDVVPAERFAAVANGAALAVLLKPSLSAAWQARGARRRIGLPTDHRRVLLTEVVVAHEEHRADAFLRVAAAANGDEPEVPALPRWVVRAQDSAPLPPDLPADMVLLLPCTRSTATVAWRGHAALARALGRRAVATGGPDDTEALAAMPCRVLPPLPLEALAALAVRATAVVGNDSGLPHLAAAARRGAGLDVWAVHIVYASTDPARTGPPGTTPWPGPRPPCWPCYAKRCDIGAPCRDLDPGALARALGSA